MVVHKHVSLLTSTAFRKIPGIDVCAKDGGQERLITKMHCVLYSNPKRMLKDSLSECNASW